MDNGDYLAGWDDHDLTRREIYRHSPQDAEAYDEYARVMARAAKAIKPILGLVPPDPSSLSWRDMKGLLKLGQYARSSLSEHEIYRIAKLVTQSSADLLDEWFETDPLKGTKAASGIIGTFLGPRSPGTAYVLLHHYMGEIDGAFRAWGFAKNGTGGVTAAIARVGARARRRDPHQRSGGQGHREAAAAPPASRSRTATSSQAKVVMSAADPKRTFLQFVDAAALPGRVRAGDPQLPRPRLVGQGQHRAVGTARLHRACRARARCTAARSRSARASTTSSAPTTTPSTASSRSQPYIDIIIPSMIDRDMAPPGQHVMSCFVQYAPYDIEGGWDDAKQRSVRRDGDLDRSSKYAPNIRQAIVGKQVITPQDIERIAGITGGNIFHGELLLHQLFFLRPAPQWADFRTPLPGYYFGAAGAHPGGGVMGAAGKMAAHEILKDWR